MARQQPFLAQLRLTTGLSERNYWIPCTGSSTLTASTTTVTMTVQAVLVDVLLSNLMPSCAWFVHQRA
jgi:hypothetical protein